MPENMTSYPSMMQTYHQKEIKYWLECQPAIANEKFIVTEKIHGANFQILIERDKPMRFFSREREIPSDENFNNHKAALEEPVVKAALARIQDVSNMLGHTFNLFGEIFGKGVQKGINYGFGDGVKVFRVFDMQIDGRWISQEGFWTYEPLEEIRVPHVGFVNSLEEALNFNVEQHTTYNPDIENNIWEGVVLKPWAGVYTSPQGSMFHIKKKHPKFEEKKNEKLPREIDPEVESINALFLGYFNDNRVQSYFSKHGEIQDKTQIGSYVKGIVEDGKADFLKDYSELLAQLDPGKHKAALNIGGTVANLLKPYL